MNTSDAIRKCIAGYHRELFPAYLESRGEGRRVRTPDEIAELGEAVKKARIKQARTAQVAIMEKLKGKFKVGTEDDEDPVVEWKTYFMQQEMQQSMSLSMLTEDLVSSVYQPSRERVDKAREMNNLPPL
jgi:hypothetical protein